MFDWAERKLKFSPTTPTRPPKRSTRRAGAVIVGTGASGNHLDLVTSPELLAVVQAGLRGAIMELALRGRRARAGGAR